MPLCCMQGRLRQDGWGSQLQQTYYDSGLLAVQNGIPTVTTPAARLMVVAGGVMALVLVAVYTANLATYLTIIGIRSNINSIADLQGRRVGTTHVRRGWDGGEVCARLCIGGSWRVRCVLLLV